MSAFEVEGGKKLSGTVRISGNKNEALPCIAASLLCKDPVTLTNVPDIGDVRSMLAIARKLGAKIVPSKDGRVTLDASSRLSSTLPLQLSSTIRGSVLFASALLVRTGKAILPQPGGDTIGRRRLDTHFMVFKALGAKFSTQRSKGKGGHTVTHILEAPNGLRGGTIYLDEASVTATENALIAASGARRQTIVANAASEPHVQGLCRFLQSLGVSIDGIGSNVLKVTPGKRSRARVTHALGCDYIEAGSFIGLAAATGSDLTIANVDPDTLRMILFQFSRLGVTTRVDRKKRTVRVPARQSLRVRKDLGGAIPRLEDSPWPGMPADLTSIMLVAATQARGTCLIHEKMFESRLFFVDTLISMGAQIVLCDPHRAVVVGPSPLGGATITSPDIRAGMALLIAALAAGGKSTIQNIVQIDRGYERIDERLRAIGARISRSPDRRRNPGASGR
ncbi:MAG: UDP-N-acetylglucosamine 1-carboxyvinyltransferase [Chitinivibrionales bacterium]|nr:UDP-N-acetylglucosamine 1-carboxyvinyltransferase [Chitinivibrionales bacterium]MBD3394100.1 UDP-N-acetylglucosamine 1-carboxyvinyltransferase [Chitinivibrionales bacterium]